MRYTKPLSLLLALLLLSLSLFGCQAPTPPAEEAFSYAESDLSPYITVAPYAWRGLTLTVEDEAAVTDETVEATFATYFSRTSSPYYCPTQDTAATVREGDTLYLCYTGILTSALEAAAAEGLIPNATATGLSYSEILSLGLGFSGGTTSGMIPLTVGSANYIDGFEDGLVGLLPSAYGEESPLALSLRFPDDYGSAELAGQDVIFFCRLFYIGDPSLGTLTAATATVEQVNAILGLTGDRAYEDVAACLARIREGLEAERESALYQKKTEALLTALREAATYHTLPAPALRAYAETVIDGYLADMWEMYQSQPYLYYTYFGTLDAPSEALLATYFGYASPEAHLAALLVEVAPHVKNELVYWSLVRAEGLSLTDADRAASREKYIALYGEDVFDGVEESVIEDQFLRDKFVWQALSYLDEQGQITYTAPKGA